MQIRPEVAVTFRRIARCPASAGRIACSVEMGDRQPRVRHDRDGRGAAINSNWLKWDCPLDDRSAGLFVERHWRVCARFAFTFTGQNDETAKCHCLRIHELRRHHTRDGVSR